MLKHLSRGGAGLMSDHPVSSGSALQVGLPAACGAVPARAARYEAGLLARFQQDHSSLARVERALKALGRSPRAA